MSATTYIGRRFDGTCRVVKVVDDQAAVQLPLRLDLVNHSPTGFEWGYGGSGPAQLALALCADATGDDERAKQVYQSVKFAIVAHLHQPHWILKREAILDAIARAERCTP